MKITIRTLDFRDLRIRISESSTVWELKRRICRLRGSWLHPENQKLLYAGQVLEDCKALRAYCIDERKFLLMLPKRATVQKAPIDETSKAGMSTNKHLRKDYLKREIMRLGPWGESEVRRALLISFNNPNRAIDYLTNNKAPFQKMITPQPSDIFVHNLKKNENHLVSKTRSKTHDLPSPEKLKSKVRFQASIDDIERLKNLGFSQDVVIEAYEACKYNAEKALLLLYKQYILKRKSGLRDLEILNVKVENN